MDIDGEPEDEVRERARRAIRNGRVRGPPPPKPDSRDAAPVELGTESWHAAVPRVCHHIDIINAKTCLLMIIVTCVKVR